MKQNLINDLENSAANVTNANQHLANVNQHNNNGGYNTTRQVRHEEKKCYAKKWKWTHYKTIVWYENVVVWNAQAFHGAVNDAKAAINRANQHLNNSRQALTNEINYIHSRQSTINNLKIQENTLNSQLLNLEYSCGVNRNNSASQLSNLQQQKTNLLSNIYTENNKLNQLNNDIRQSEIEKVNLQGQKNISSQRVLQIDTEYNNEEIKFLRQLKDLSKEQIAEAAFYTYQKEQKLGKFKLFKIIENLGFDLEFMALLAAKKQDVEVLKYCVSKGVNFKTYYGKQTLAEYIINTKNDELIQIMKDGDLSLATYNACINGEYELLEQILKLDKGALGKINKVKFLDSINILKLAIAKNDIKLIEFVHEHHLESFALNFEDQLNYLLMSLEGNQHDASRALLKYFDQDKCLEAICQLKKPEAVNIKISKFSLIENLLDKAEFSEELLYKVALYSVQEENMQLAEKIIDKIGDPEKQLVKLITKSDISEEVITKIAIILETKANSISLQFIKEQLQNTSEFVANLEIKNMFKELLEVGGNEDLEENQQIYEVDLGGEENYQISFDN